MDDRTFRTAMGRFATGVTIITTQVEDAVRGMTANAFMSVSLQPKLVLISVDENANLKQYINQSGKFAISILNETQQDLSSYFAGQKKEKMDVLFNWFNGMPTIQDSLVNLTCDVHDVVVAGDHTLYIGKVTDVCLNEGEPLTFYGGAYKHIHSCEEVK